MRVQVDWTDWSFGPGRHPIAGAVSAGTLACSVTMAGSVTGLLPAGWPIVAGAVLASAALAAGAWQAMPAAAVLYRMACWLGAGAWSSATLLWSDPWSRWPLITLATGTAVAAVVGTGLARMDRPEPAKPGKPAEAERQTMRDKYVAQWEVLIRRITRREVTVTQLERWEPPTGFTLHVELPGDGTTVRDIKDYETQLAYAANLPEGCNIEVQSAAGRRRSCLIRVATENTMAEMHHIPDSVTALSINDPLPLGFHAGRVKATISLRFACGVLVGQTDSGKSNTLNVITHQLVRCADTVVWAIDCSGKGRYPRPWLRAWAEGRAPVPPLDWVAAEPSEAKAMATAALSIINGRTAAYERLMHEANEDKLPVSPQVPQIVIVTDEFADLPADVKDLLETISNTGRGAGVRLVTSVLRAIGVNIPRSMIVQARERIAMRVSDEAELQYLFDAVWSRGRFDPASLTPYQGTGLLSTGMQAPAPFKAWRVEPKRIDAVAVAVARLRPVLDEVSVRLAGPAYSGRWERTLPVMFPSGGQSPLVRREATAESTVVTIVEPTTEQGETVNLDESAKRLEAAREAARRAREEAEARQSEPEPDWSVPEGWLAEASAAGPAPSLPPRVRMRQLVQEHRRDGIGPRAVWQTLQSEGHGTAEQTVITWMRADAAAGVLAQPGGKGSPYVPGPKFSLEP